MNESIVNNEIPENMEDQRFENSDLSQMIKPLRKQMHNFMNDTHIHLVCKGKEFIISEHVWNDFAYFRVLNYDEKIQNFKLVIADDMIDIVNFMVSIQLPFKDMCGSEMYDFAVSVRNYAQILGLDPLSKTAGKLHSLLYRCAYAYASSQQCWELIEIVFDVETHRHNWFFKGSKMKAIVFKSLFPIDGDAIDIRNLEVLRKIKNDPESDREKDISKSIVELLQN